MSCSRNTDGSTSTLESDILPRGSCAGEAPLLLYFRDPVKMLTEIFSDPDLKGDSPEDGSRLCLRAYRQECVDADGVVYNAIRSPMTGNFANEFQVLIETALEAGSLGSRSRVFTPEVRLRGQCLVILAMPAGGRCSIWHGT